MKLRTRIRIAISAFALGAIGITALASQGGLSAFATTGPNAKKAQSEAAAARKAIAKRKGAQAVQHAELAVANDPTNAEYRAMLGQAYLLAGRFTSAAQALTDALALNPEDGRVALNLTLATIAKGDWAGARALLQTHADHIPASDRGLAFALAGDPVTAVEILTPAARDEFATVKTRQNLALSLALAGRWKEASEIAAMDVAPDQLQPRLLQWAAFAKPANAYDQVASLLGVQAVEDGGQPVALALAGQGNAVASVAIVPVPEPVSVPVVVASADPVAAQPAAEAAVEMPAEPQPEPEQVAGTGGQVVFGARDEIVQRTAAAEPARTPAATRAGTAIRSAPASATVTVAAKPARGAYYVQLGAYPNAAVARDAWARHQRRVAALSGTVPQGAQVHTRAGNFYRLSVGGFARADAQSLCRQVKARGGTCFVRTQAGDAVAVWVKPGTQVASR